MWEEEHFFILLQISLVSGLIEDSCILMSASEFSLLWYHVLQPLEIELYIHERVRIKKTNNVLLLLSFAKIHFDFTEPLEA